MFCESSHSGTLHDRLVQTYTREINQSLLSHEFYHFILSEYKDLVSIDNIRRYYSATTTLSKNLEFAFKEFSSQNPSPDSHEFIFNDLVDQVAQCDWRNTFSASPSEIVKHSLQFLESITGRNPRKIRQLSQNLSKDRSSLLHGYISSSLNETKEKIRGFLKENPQGILSFDFILKRLPVTDC